MCARRSKFDSHDGIPVNQLLVRLTLMSCCMLNRARNTLYGQKSIRPASSNHSGFFFGRFVPLAGFDILAERKWLVLKCCVCVALSAILWCACICVFCLLVSTILCSPSLCHFSITISSSYLLLWPGPAEYFKKFEVCYHPQKLDVIFLSAPDLIEIILGLGSSDYWARSPAMTVTATVVRAVPRAWLCRLA